jgi:putative membrane protein
MSLRKRFSDEDLERVKAAVRQAESKISGEIVPVFVEKSGFYSVANYRAGMVASALMFLLVILFDRYMPTLAIYDPLFIFLLVVMAGLIGGLACNYLDFIKRIFVPQDHLDRATRQRAETAFLQEEVFNTRHRTGIMIFISFFEREVMVIADRGISKVVDQKEWDNMVQGIIQNIRLGKVVDGLEAAILRCGEILLEKGFLKTEDDVNELKDDLRIE